MRRGLIALTILLGLGLLLQFGCNGNTRFQAASNGGGSASLAVFGGDAPECGVLSFQVEVTEVDLVPQGGGTSVVALSSSDAISVDFAALTGFHTILNLATVPAGTYSQAKITLSNPQITILDTTVNPPAAETIPTSFPSSAATVTAHPNINPVLVIQNGAPQGLILDFNLRKSIQVDGSGQVTGVVNPTFRVLPSVITLVKGLGELDDLHGTVESVSTTSSDPNFVGSFTLQRPSGRTLLVNVTNSTEFENVSGLSGLAPGMFVEFDAHVDAKGNITAEEVEVEEQTDVTRAVLFGTVTSVSPSLGGASSFRLFVSEEFPDVENVVPLRSQVTVNITANTVMRVAFGAQSVNQAGLLFSTTSITPAEHVAVLVPISGSMPQSIFNANGIVLRQHGYLGNLSGTPTVSASDPKAGLFSFTICSPTLQGQPVTVVTFSDTQYENGLTDLPSLTSTQTLIVRGLLFYEAGPVTINGMPVSTPGWVLEAGVVRELQ